MNKRIIIILIIFVFCILVASPVFAKEKVKIKISTDDNVFSSKGEIVIKLVDGHGRLVRSEGTIHYNVTDAYGNYKWAYKPYNGEIRLKYDVGDYIVDVKFDGDFQYKSAKKVKVVTVTSQNLDPYTYYDDHSWGLNQRIDDYIEETYWDEDIYDDAETYDGEGY